MTAILVFMIFAGETWQLKGPEGGFVTDLNTHQTQILAATFGNGVFQSANGNQWSELSPDLRFRSSNSIGSSPRLIIVSIQDDGLWRSDDHGVSFYKFTPDTLGFTFNTILIKDLDTIIAGSDGKGIITHTPENGWQRSLNLDIKIQDIKQINLLKIAGTEDGLYRSLHGLSWQRYPGSEQPPDTNITSIAKADTLVYVGTESAVYFTREPIGTGPWTFANLPTEVTDFAVLADSIYAATFGGVFASKIGTTIWSSTGMIKYPYVTSLYCSSTMKLAGTSAGIYRYENGWIPSYQGLLGLFASDLAYDQTNPNRLFMTTWGSGLLYSDDCGETWVNLPVDTFTVFIINDVEIPRSNPNFIYLLDPYQGIFKSEDGGSHFKFIYQDSLNLLNDIEVYPYDGHILLASTKKDLLLTTDAGANWSSVDSNNYNNLEFSLFDNIILASVGSHPFRSINWNFPMQDLGNFGDEITDIEFDHNLAGVAFVSTHGGIFRTQDYGDHFQNVFNNNVVSLSPSYGNLLMANTHKDGVWLTLDGSFWFNFNPGLTIPYPLFLNGNIDRVNHRCYEVGTSGFWTYVDTIVDITVNLSSDTISPDGDTYLDSVVFSFPSTELCGIRSWRLQLCNSDTVADTSGYGPPPDLVWDGYDHNGNQVPDSSYLWRFECRNGLNAYFADSGSLIVDAKPMVSGLAGATEFNFQNKIVRKGGTTSVFYVSGSPGEVFYCLSTDHGTTWQGPTNLSNSKGTRSSHPCAITDGDAIIHAVWEEDTLLVTKASDDWQILDTIPGSGRGTDPSLIRDGGDLVLFFSRNNDIYYSRYNLVQKAWQQSTNVLNTGGVSQSPSATRTNDGFQHLLFADNTNGPFEINYTFKQPGGPWEQTIVISRPEEYSISPCLAGKDLLYAAWQESTTTWIAFSILDPDSGWTPVDLIANSQAPPTISGDTLTNGYLLFISGDTISMMYYDHQLGKTPIRDLYTSTEPIHGLTSNPEVTDSLMVLWTEGQSPPFHIFYMAFGPGTDTIPPRFNLTYPETLLMGDSCTVVIEPDEALVQPPDLYIEEETLEVLVDTLIPDQYYAIFKAEAMSSGNHEFITQGRDRSGNLGVDSSLIMLERADTTVFDDKEIFVWPNPCDDDLHLHYRLHENAKVTLEIFSITGRRIDKFNLNAQSEVEGSQDVDASTYGNGLYIFRVSVEGEESGKKKVKAGRFAVVH